MYLFYDLLASHPLLYAVQLLFTIGMIVHAYRRGVEQWWFYVIFFVQPVGAWVYFFAVFLPHFQWTAPFWERKTPVEELRFRAQSSPTFANHFALAQRLIELNRFEEAIPPLQEARKREPDHSPACYALARCMFEIQKPNDALPLIQRILDKEPRWEDYAAWRLLIRVQEDLNLGDAALETARHLVKISPRMEHKYLLANQLAQMQQDGEARILLENALQEQQFVSAPVRRLNRKWVKEARRLLGELSPR
jgi:hypothetical protein